MRRRATFIMVAAMTAALFAVLHRELGMAASITYFHCVPKSCNDSRWSCSSGNFKIDSIRKQVNDMRAVFTTEEITWQDTPLGAWTPTHTWTLNRTTLDLKSVTSGAGSPSVSISHCRIVPNFHGIDGY